jgi:hypothetical protein
MDVGILETKFREEYLDIRERETQQVEKNIG